MLELNLAWDPLRDIRIVLPHGRRLGHLSNHVHWLPPVPAFPGTGCSVVTFWWPESNGNPAIGLLFFCVCAPLPIPELSSALASRMSLLPVLFCSLFGRFLVSRLLSLLPLCRHLLDSFFFSFFVFLPFSQATPTAYGGSQAGGRIGAIAAVLHQGHSNAGSEPRLRPTLQLTAMPIS